MDKKEENIDEKLEEKTSQNISLEVDDIADSLVNEMPEVQTHAVEAFENAEELEENNNDLTDIDGNTFDPEFHQTDAEGKPKLTKAGNIAKKRGKKSAKTKSILGKKNPTVNQQVGVSENHKMLGKTAAAATVTCGMALFGQSFAPRQIPEEGIDEMKTLTQVWGDWFKANNMEDLPPNTALAIGLAFYALPRFAEPEPRQRLKSLTGKIKDFFTKKKGKKENAAHDDNRADNERENDTGKKNSE